MALSVGQLDLPAIMTTEDMTNAVWNRILHETFPSPQYLISPEFHWANQKTKEAGRADLAVIETVVNKVVLVYEGKKEGGGIYSLSDALSQSVNCLKAENSQLGVAVAALGPTFIVTDIGKNETTKFKPDVHGTFWVQNNLNQLAEYLAKTAAKGGRPI